MSSRHEDGMKTRRSVLGDAHVDRAEAAKTEFDAPFQAMALARQRLTRTGATKEDVMQAFLHVAIYAGVPKANHAIKLAKETFAEMEAGG